MLKKPVYKDSQAMQVNGEKNLYVQKPETSGDGSVQKDATLSCRVQQEGNRQFNHAMPAFHIVKGDCYTHGTPVSNTFYRKND